MRRVVVSADTSTMIPDIFAGAVVNAGQTGYFCVRYQDQAFTALRDRFGSLTADDQLGILLDMENFCLAGATSAAGFLDLASRTPPDADPAVWSMLADEFSWLDLMHDGLASQAAFRAYARGQLAPECQRIGFDSKAGESEDTAILRSRLLSAMGRLSDAAVVKEAQRRFSHYLQDPVSLSGSARDSVLTIVAMNADQATWDKLHSLARTATSSVEKQDYYSYLGGALDPALGLRALDLALADEVEVTIRPVIIRSVSYKHPMMAFDYAVRHWEDLGKLIEDPDRRSVFIAYLLSNANKTEVLIRLDAFAAAHVSPSNKTDIRKIAAAVRDLARIRTERLPEIDRWVAARVGAPGP
jgi:aminopeptidase N